MCWRWRLQCVHGREASVREGRVLTTTSHTHLRLTAALEANGPTPAPLPAPTTPPPLGKDVLLIIFYHILPCIPEEAQNSGKQPTMMKN